jgi:branched-chain amino acid aminotransferase
VAPATEYKFYILASPTGGYFGGLEKGVPATINIFVTDKHVRAVRGGVGAAKTGANYAASLLAVSHAKKLGYSNVLFLDAILQKNIEELSGMNVFIYAKGILRTPLLKDTILDGVTRKSILTLAQKSGVKVIEEDISIETIYEYANETNSDLEIFACGTGAAVAGISELNYKENKIVIAGGKPGVVTTKLYNLLLDLQFGRNQKDFPEWRVSV